MIAKLENGRLTVCPKCGRDGGRTMHTDLPKYYERNPAAAAEDGYYPVRYTEKPEGDYAPTWELQNGEIVQVWTAYTPQPEPPTAEERLDTVEECILEMSEIVYA
ncbi:MAG: hypothetical protein IJT44_03570 [Clostridia bacterium]|nr:hypothetical protein [Clostridia bacterium]